MTITQIQDMLDRYLAAEQALLEGKNFMWGNRLLQRENLAEIRAGRQEWEAKLASAQRGGRSNHSLATFN